MSYSISCIRGKIQIFSYNGGRWYSFAEMQNYFLLLVHLNTVIFRLQQVKGLDVLLDKAGKKKLCSDMSVIYQQEEVYTVTHLWNSAKQKHPLENTNWDHTEQVVWVSGWQEARLPCEFLNTRKVVEESTIS